MYIHLLRFYPKKLHLCINVPGSLILVFGAAKYIHPVPSKIKLVNIGGVNI